MSNPRWENVRHDESGTSATLEWVIPITLKSVEEMRQYEPPSNPYVVTLTESAGPGPLDHYFED